MAMDEFSLTKEMRQRAGYQEILGETLAKFEFFQHGWHPYSRFLDVDKVDLLLRRRNGGDIQYREVQVKFGKLYACRSQWERNLFSRTSWRFFSEKNLTDLEERGGLFLAYVLAPDDGFKGDMFVFPMGDFIKTIRAADRLANGNYRVYISRTVDETRWYVRRRWTFSTLDNASVIDVSKYYRNFGCLE
jgi:hypothetical protein